MTATPDAPLIRVEGLRVEFGRGAAATTAIAGLDLSLGRGECVALVGESGSGKSVSARSLIGLAGRDAHVTATTLEIDGRDARGFGERQWRRIRGSRIGFVLQDALSSLDPLRTVGAEIGEAVRATGGPRGRAGRVRALELLRRAHVPQPERRIDERPSQLSGGQRQRALIASALAGEPAVLIADEPTTALDVSVQKQILALFAELKAQGHAILLISHDLAVVSELADRIHVLRRGAVVESGRADAVLSAPEHPYTRSLIDAIPRFDATAPRHTASVAVAVEPPAALAADPSAAALAAYPSAAASTPASSATVAPSPPPATGGTPLVVEDVSKRFRLRDDSERTALESVSLRLTPGRSLGVVGESGSGKTTLARVIAGFEQPDSGRVSGLGDDPRDVQFVYQDPGASFDPRWDVGRLLGEAIELRHGRLAAGERRRRSIEWLHRVGLSEEHLGRRPSALSGGQRQRVGIARALAVVPRYVILDEPVSALDVAVQSQILDLIADLQEETGVGYLFISHDLGVVQRVCDTLLVLRHGVVRETGPTDRVLAAPADDYTRELIDAVPVMPGGAAPPVR
ncbi:ABC transporter ATP-binding protein [Mycetocola reblochoni]|uniref:ABC transporter ATP-binding protein n=1 Tax=Mycetocola reblochoni TaxID=331618 RepID=A0A3L6ZSH8_9MICO|nr:ABC transporter ATP-binding protein [Mycetocola reblochoni]RLP70906.1 ABC transporter ATP-binding protein [Mycetocola reblochoni]